MSKMSQLHVELTEQASELGFESLDEALANGYEVDYEKGRLVKRGLGYSETVEFLAKEQEKAHEVWLKEREEVVADLERLITAYAGAEAVTKPVRKAINFIMKGEM